MGRRKLIIDTDPGVDDALAIFMAFNTPDVEVLGLTTIFGNVTTPMATANALHLCEMAKRTDVPVAQGALGPLTGGVTERIADFVHGSDGLGNTGASAPSGSPCGVSAAQFIADAVRAAPGEVTLLALASLTNVVLAVRLDPAVATNLGSLVVLGGAFNCMGNVNPAAEANIWNATMLFLHDPEAADEAFGMFPDGVVRIVGLDVTQQAIMSAAQLDTLRDSGGRFSTYSWSICQFYKAYHVRSVGLDGIFLHDPTALVAVLAPQLFGWHDGAVRVACDGLARGKTLLDTGAKNWVGDNDWKGRPKCRVALSLDSPGVLAVVTQLLSR